jgi:glycosyltransferase involved in cell wall biosynthesis
LKIQLFVRSYVDKYGLSRYTESICTALENAGIDYRIVTPEYPLWVKAAHAILQPFGFDTKRFFTTYPISAQLDKNALIHLTTQQMATMLWRRPHLHPTVITVHDIIPYLFRNDKEQSTFRHPFDYYVDGKAMHHLVNADLLISISQFTKKTLIENLSIPEGKIHVVLYGVDHNTFKPVEVADNFHSRYEIPGDHKIILYVGSENPRKNLTGLMKAFATLKPKESKYMILKIGTPEYIPQYQKLKALIQDLSLEDNVTFINHPTEEDLVAFYNVADLFVFPSIYEGFGLPPLEAMACGTPVVCSNAASLPEVVGDAAITFDPYDTAAIAGAMRRVLEDSELAAELRQKGIARASQFTWERTARETIAVYQKVLELQAA